MENEGQVDEAYRVTYGCLSDKALDENAGYYLKIRAVCACRLPHVDLLGVLGENVTLGEADQILLCSGTTSVLIPLHIGCRHGA